MNSLITEEEIDIMIFGLSEKCPYTNGNPIDCQLHEVRKLSSKERVLIIKSLNYTEKVKLYHKHKECLMEKERRA